MSGMQQVFVNCRNYFNLAFLRLLGPFSFFIFLIFLLGQGFKEDPESPSLLPSLFLPIRDRILGEYNQHNMSTNISVHGDLFL